MTHMAQGVGSGMGASKGQGWAHSRLVWVSVVMFVVWALSVSWVHAKPKAPPSPLPQVTQLGQGTLTLKQGTSGVLQATLSPTPTAPGVLAVSSDAPATVSVPATITFAAGQTQVGIPVTAEYKGQADITVSLNGSSRSAKVNVTPAPSRLLSLSPAQATLQPGATLVLQVSLTPRKPGSAVTLQLSSSDPAKVYVPASITLTEGQTTASFTARAMGEGSATITAQLNNSGVNSIATAQIQVVPSEQGPLSVVSLAPPTSSIEQGAQTTLTLTLSATASTPTTVPLQARTPGVLSLPTQVVVPTGQRSASFPVQGMATGQTLVVATLGTSSTEAAVRVTPVPARLASLEPTQTQLTVNAQATLTARLNAAQPTDTRVALSTQPPGVAQVPAEVLVPAGQTQATLSVTALAVGQAEVVASLNGSTQRAGITVTPEPVKVAALLPQPLGIQEGASGALTVRLSAAPSDAVVVTLTSSNTAVAQLPGSVSFAPGTLEQSVVVTGVQAGSSQITATLNGASVSTTVQVSTPPPRLSRIEPPVLDLPKGQLGQLTLTLDRAPLAPTVITVQNSNPAALQVPEQVTVAAGQLSAALSLVSLQQGSAQITATLNNGSGGSTLQATVNVVPPQIVAITVTPPSASLGAGQSLQLQAEGTYTDASTRTITTDATTLWKSESSSTAAVTSTGPTAGQITGQQPGQTRITAEQTPAALQGQGAPQTVQGSAAVVVSDAGALSLTASRTSLTVGETVPVLLALPYPVAQPVTVNLTASAGLQVPASLTLAAGENSRTFNAQATAVGTSTLSAVTSSAGVTLGSAQLAFSISAAVPTGPVINSVAPNAGAPGTPVTLSGSGFASTASGNTVVFTADLAGGAPAVVQSASSTQLVVTVPAAAQTGPITVTTTAGTGTSPIFTVQRDQAFDLQSSPSQLSVMQGSQASAVIQLASSGVRAYEGLAKLSITGLPAGITARFEPAQISAQQSGQLILSAASSAALGSSTLTLQASATLDGLPWVRQSQITAQVITRANVTGVKGRFVTPQGQGIAGVIVRHENSTSNQVVTDAAGNFLITSLPSGVSTLRFDATPAHALYPIWPYSVTLQAGEVLTLSDWTINPPPTDEQFTPIANAAGDQAITDPRYPGFAVTLPAGVSITGWDGVKKTRIAVQRIEPNQLPVASPPFAMKEAYQLYFGTPMGGIPSAPIPVTLPNVADKEPGEKVDIWFFDGSPMGGTGEWKMAGQGTVSADGKTVTSDPGAGLTRFCGVCGLVSLNCPPVPKPPQACTCTTCECSQQTRSGDSTDTYSGQALPATPGINVGGGLTPLSSGLSYNPVDAFNNRAGTLTSFGYGWTSEHDVSFLPFAGSQKRLVMPGGQFVNLVDDGSGKYRPADDPRYAGTYAEEASGGAWTLHLKGGATWRFEPFAGITGVIRGGPPLFLTRITDTNGNSTTLARQSNGRLLSVQGLDGRRINLNFGANGFANQITDHTGRTHNIEYTASASPRISALVDAAGRRTEYSYQSAPVYRGAAGQIACEAELPAGEPQYLSSIKYPHSSTPTVNTYNTDRIVQQSTAEGQVRKYSYKRIGACVVKVQDEATKTAAFTCRAGQSLGVAQGTGTCPEIDSEEARAQGWRFYGGTNVQTQVTEPDGTQTTNRFNARGQPAEHIDAAGQRTHNKYDANSRLVERTDALGRTTKYEYDSAGNQIATTNPLGIRVETAYEPVRNKPTTLTRFLLGVPSQQGGLQLSYTPVSQSMTYDAKGNLTQVLDPTGISGQMAYDAKGQLSSITLPARSTASSLPVVSEGTASSIAKAARQIALSYNAAGDLSKITDALNNATNLGTDTLGRTTSSTDPLGYTSTQSYNTLDQPTDAKNPLNHTTRFTYDAAGRTTGVVNEAGVTIESYTHDSQGRVTQVKD
ncbi:Ig-like domain-containing protein, partial [Hydrogenophaga sp.]|uniref:Ig-like domain-containing protein n=1 Tax=Hydrogenophaga sp. TaxID=1904254 RepID=UPI002ABB2704